MSNCSQDPSRNPQTQPGRWVRGSVGILLGLAALGCRTSDEFRDSADAEVYEIVSARRAEIASGERSFTIEPKEDSLRRRVLEGEVSRVGPLGLEDCLTIGAENSRDYQRQRELLYLAALDLTLERFRFDNQFGAFLAGDLTGQGDDVTNAAAGGGASVSRLLGNGARIVGNVGLSLFRTLATSDGWDLVSNLGISITQPLLRGSERVIVIESLTAAEREVVYQARDYERFRRAFAVDVASRYYGVLQQLDRVRNEQRNFDNLAVLSARNRALSEAGRLSEIQSDQAKQDELRSQNRLIDAEQRLQALLDQFKFFLGLPLSTELVFDLEELDRLDEVLLPELDVQRVVDLGLRERLDYLTAKMITEDAGRRLNIAKDALRGDLALVANAGAVSTEGRPLDLRGDNVNWSVGLDYDLPVNRVAERNAYRRALIDFQVARRAYEQAGDGIVADLRDAVRNLRNAAQTYEIQAGAAILAERRVESANLTLLAGRASTRDVLESQESLLQARNAATGARINFLISRLSLFRDMEFLRLGPEGISIDPELEDELFEVTP